MIFFDHIKGCSRNTTSYKDGLWTWIQFAKSGAAEDKFFANPYPEVIVASGSNGIWLAGNNNDGNNTNNYLINPEVFKKAATWKKADDTTADTSVTTAALRTLGYILTTKGPAQTINKSITVETPNKITLTKVEWTLYGNKGYTKNDVQGSIVMDSSSTDAQFNINYNSSEDGASPSKLLSLSSNGVTVDSIAQFSRTVTCSQDVTCKSQVTAVTFNATSDKRAKTNIQPMDKTLALDIVNKLPVYSFNYKADNCPSVGVLAQEAALYDNAIPNFSLVSNEQATGVNGDYQTVKESKLVYILWAAVQAQNAEIQHLKARIDKLEAK